MLFPCRNWKPTLAIKLSLLILAGCIGATLCYPLLWKWMLGVIFVNHSILTIAGLVPRSTLLGPNITRLPLVACQNGAVAITIDDGPDPEVTPQVLDILDRYQAKATFFCIGRIAVQHPELCREIIRRGHAIENHSMSHQWYFSLLDPWSIYREVQKAQQMLTEIGGQEPRFFRATAGLRNPELEPVLAHCGLRLCSWSRRGFDTQINNADTVFNSLVHNLKSGDILLLHDGSAARTAQGQPVILNVLPRLLDNLAQSGLHSVTLRSAIP
ncbi:polysaccharide deacetylase family protein [Sideroxydans lithotrophicus]|uniref:Polysaccharide deacetylase n=1 Tax=Sideroxydans lithotrophicus (strain ES-1) TaxID=580332 RepID=D5CNT1_SIDLE|nr:polysaccharide deacetylase family protein [Sideroxydans lithotrophicus]ADE12852.1 polysaccharide deacetylase [Sideroxydans lithotrophicus ES-1]